MKKLEFYCVRPNLHQIFGRKVTDDLEFDEYNDDKTIHQIMKNRVLTTIIDKEYEQVGCKIKEYSKTEVEYPAGAILIWNEQVGYIMPQVEVCTLNEVEQDIKDMRNVYEKPNKEE